jgi:hypothetical protein
MRYAGHMRLQSILAFLVAGLLAPRAATRAVTLAWTASATTDEVVYVVNYGTRANRLTTHVQAGMGSGGPNLECTIVGLRADTEYFFGVQASNTVGLVSVESNIIALPPKVSATQQ